MRYIEFRTAIAEELRRSPGGLTWAELRDRLQLPYDRPCSTWVQRLEQEIALSRDKGTGRALVWKIGAPTSADHAEGNNQQLWDELAPVHFRSYREVAMLKSGGEVLDELELAEIGDVAGRALLHLQCHIGTDTLAWARRGAIVTGVDFSARSIEYAERLREELRIPATFLRSNIYDLPQLLDQQFDIVYTSRGVLCWLRDLTRWGAIVARYLKPGGRFYLMESHPTLNIFDDAHEGPLTVAHSYFHDVEPVRWDDDSPDYADDSYVPQRASYEWVWSISDVVNALIGAGLQLESVGEYDRIFDRCFPGMEECRERWFHLPQYAGKLPLTFTVCARKPDRET